MGVLADIQALSANSSKLATDQASVTAEMAKLQAAQDAVASDTTASQQADATLSADLQADGPAFVLNDDGSASVYAFATTPPGYTITVAKPAS